MDLKRIEALLELLANHDVSEFSYKDGDASIELRLGQPVASVAAAPVAMPVAAPVAAATAAPPAPVDDGLITVESPMVGTFYRASGPGAASFVEVGTLALETPNMLAPSAMASTARSSGMPARSTSRRTSRSVPASGRARPCVSSRP